MRSRNNKLLVSTVELKKKIFTAALFFTSIFASLALSEAVLRWTGFEYRLFPARVEFGWPDPVVLKDQFTVDKELLWVPQKYGEIVAGLRDSRPKIVFMGDSCTAWGNYSRLFESIINQAHAGNNFSFVNAGVGGWTSHQGLEQLKRDIVPMRPEIITIYYGWNDHWLSFGVADKDIGAFNADRSLALNFDDLRLVQLFSYFAIKLYGKSADAGRPRRVSEEDFKANIRAMVQTAREHGIVPVLLTAPSSHTVGQEPAYLAERWLADLGELVPIHSRYAELVREVAREEQVLLVDLLDMFYRYPSEDLKKKYFVEDGIHLTSEGCWELANKLYWTFEEEGLLQRIVE